MRRKALTFDKILFYETHIWHYSNRFININHFKN